MIRRLPRSRALATVGIDRARLFRFGLALLAVLLLALAARPSAARPAPDSFADLAEASLPAVVNISTTQTIASAEGIQDLDELFRQFLDRQEGEEPAPRKANSLGSGFIVDPAGYVVTNNHVIQDAEEITVILHDNREFKAEIVGRDAKTDLALLKISAKEALPALAWGDSDSLRIGDWVLAIGNPFGLGGSVTAGIVSARQRDINAGPYDDFIQTDAAINRGNSGGPMFDMDGHVVGINSAIYSPSGGSVGIGFAIPSNLARPIVAQLREFGHAKRGWLGVQIQNVTPELAEGLRLPDTKGALVASVTADSPAAAAGIRQGDVILSFDGHQIGEMRSLPRLVAESAAGRKVAVDLWRQGARMSVTVALGELKEEAAVATAPESSDAAPVPGKAEAIVPLGLEILALDDAKRDELGLAPDLRGVVVTGIAKDGPAAEKGMEPGDVIVEVDQKAVAEPADVKERVAAAIANGYRVVTLLINRKGDFQWIALKIAQG